MTKQEVIDELIKPYLDAVASDTAAMLENPSPAMQAAWRKCIAEGKPPVYVVYMPGLMADTMGFDIEFSPPEGWK